jgi:hypothetical protein
VDTSGPEIVIDVKGGDMIENLMRAYVAEHDSFEEGLAALKEDIVYFPVPQVLPGITFFDVRQGTNAEDGFEREDVAANRGERFEEVLETSMGEKYSGATNAPTLIKTGIKLLFDSKYGRRNGRYRESEDYYEFDQFAYLIDELQKLANSGGEMGSFPESSDEYTLQSLRRRIGFGEETFGNVIAGVSSRMEYVGNDRHIRRLFNNTTPKFDFKELFDSEKIVLMDLGGLRDDPQVVMSSVLLTAIFDALKRHKSWLKDQPEDYVVNLIMDEAQAVTSSRTMSRLLEGGREFRIGVGLSAQFPEQFAHNGDQEVYANVLNNVGTKLIGKIPVDQQLAQALATEEMPPAEVEDRLRSMPRGEWFVDHPSTRHAETGARPYSMKPLDIPAGHPESDEPLTEEEEERFGAAVEELVASARENYGVVDNVASVFTEAPLEVVELAQAGSTDVDAVLAQSARAVQASHGEAGNGAVAIGAAIANLASMYETADVSEDDRHGEVPSDRELVAIMERSRLLEVLDPAEVAGGGGGDGAGGSEAGNVEGDEAGGEDGDREKVALADPDAIDDEGKRERGTDDAGDDGVNEQRLVRLSETGIEELGDRPRPDTAGGSIGGAAAPETGAGPPRADTGEDEAGGDAGGTMARGTAANASAGGEETERHRGGAAADENQMKGGPKHEGMIARVDDLLVPLGWGTSHPDQSSDEKPDGRLYYLEGHFITHVEVETTTADVPRKIIQNYKKAASEGNKCLFVVEPKAAQPDYWVRRIESTLGEPVKKRRPDGVTELYTDASVVAFAEGGGNVNKPVTALRPRGEDDNGWTVWTRTAIEDSEEYEYTLWQGTGGEEVLRMRGSELENIEIGDVSATYRSDHEGGYRVYQGTSEDYYESLEKLEEDWAEIKRPLIPEEKLPERPVAGEDYAVLVMPDRDAASGGAGGGASGSEDSGGSAGILETALAREAGESDDGGDGGGDEGDDEEYRLSEPVVYLGTKAVTPSSLAVALADKDVDGEIEAMPVGPSEDEEGSDEELAGPTYGESKERFIEECLFTAGDLDADPELEEAAVISNGDLVLPKDDAVDAFNAWQAEHLSERELPEAPKNKSRFARDVLRPYADGVGMEIDDVYRTLDGDRVYCYEGFGLTERGKSLL